MKLDLVIVDDSTVWLSLAKRLALQNPHVNSVTTFNDTLEAWVFVQTNRPNAILTDIEMPGMNGFSFLTMFAHKISMVSSSTKEGFAQLARELGSSSFLTKPFSKKDFDWAISEIHQQLSGVAQIS